MVAMVDTNCDPEWIMSSLSNDDAIRAIKLLVAKMADAVLEGKAMRQVKSRRRPGPIGGDYRQARGRVELEEDRWPSRRATGEAWSAESRSDRRRNDVPRRKSPLLTSADEQPVGAEAAPAVEEP